MSQRPTLDRSSFETLLSAAWVLQCQREKEARYLPAPLTLADEETRPKGAPAGALTITLAADEASPAAANQNSGNDVQDLSPVTDNSVSWPVVREHWELGTVSVGHHAWHASQALPMVPC